MRERGQRHGAERGVRWGRPPTRKPRAPELGVLSAAHACQRQPLLLWRLCALGRCDLDRVPDAHSGARPSAHAAADAAKPGPTVTCRLFPSRVNRCFDHQRGRIADDNVSSPQHDQRPVFLLRLFLGQRVVSVAAIFDGPVSGDCHAIADVALRPAVAAASGLHLDARSLLWALDLGYHRDASVDGRKQPPGRHNRMCIHGADAAPHDAAPHRGTHVPTDQHAHPISVDGAHGPADNRRPHSAPNCGPSVSDCCTVYIVSRDVDADAGSNVGTNAGTDRGTHIRTN
mmetsp:Transcript_10369/g.26571  ORF Transcript_10369/g.26571 Transcript_10369/m.26571 type:complete len:286 (+) Transcript_10369:2268-3125(+)